DLHAMGVDSHEGNNDDATEIQNIANSLKELDDNTSFGDIDDIRDFIHKFTAAGGKDISKALSKLPEVDEGIQKIKAELGLGENEPLSKGYESDLMQKMIEGIMTDDLSGVING